MNLKQLQNKYNDKQRELAVLKQQQTDVIEEIKRLKKELHGKSIEEARNEIDALHEKQQWLIDEIQNALNW